MRVVRSGIVCSLNGTLFSSLSLSVSLALSLSSLPLSALSNSRSDERTCLTYLLLNSVVAQ